jgi:hypothetical protein
MMYLGIGLMAHFKVLVTKRLRTILIASSSDIASHLVKHYLRQGGKS